MRGLTSKVHQRPLKLGPGLYLHIPLRSPELALVGADLLVWIGDHNLLLCRGLHWDWQMLLGEICFHTH